MIKYHYIYTKLNLYFITIITYYFPLYYNSNWPQGNNKMNICLFSFIKLKKKNSHFTVRIDISQR